MNCGKCSEHGICKTNKEWEEICRSDMSIGKLWYGFGMKMVNVYEKLVFDAQGMPSRILDVAVMPSWAIDAGTD